MTLETIVGIIGLAWFASVLSKAWNSDREWRKRYRERYQEPERKRRDSDRAERLRVIERRERLP